MKFDRLYNFISPVTGRVLCNPDYVLLGDDRGVAMPSPIIIDIKLDMVNLRQDVNSLLDSTFVLNFPNIDLPNAQVLSTLPDGFMSNIGGLISTSSTIPSGVLTLTLGKLFIGGIGNIAVETQIINLNNLPNLTFKNIWRGDGSNRPVESNAVTVLESDMSDVLSDISNIFSTLSSLQSIVTGLQSAVAALEAGLASVGGWAAILLMQTQIVALDVAVGIHGTRLDGIDSRIDGLTVNLGGDVTGSGLLSSTITTTLTLTLDEIPLAVNSVDLNDQKIITLADPVNPQDAVNLRTLESYIDDVPLDITLVGDVTGSGVTGSPITTTLELTLDQIRLAEDTVDLNNNKIINLVSDDVEQLDALNAKFLWDLMHDNVGVVWI